MGDHLEVETLWIWSTSASMVLCLIYAATAAPVAKTSADTSHAGVTQPITTGEALASIPAGLSNDAVGAYESNPLYFDPHLRDHIKLTVTPSNTGCGSTGKEHIRPFYVNSAAGDSETFHFCEDGTCHLTLELDGETAHNDVGFLRLRGCPLHQGYTVPYLRIMKSLLASFDVLHIGYGACDQGETQCEIGTDISLAPGECKTLTHPSIDDIKFDVCYQGPGTW